MKPSEHWIAHDQHPLCWERYEEQLDDGLWMVAFRHPAGYDIELERDVHMGAGWVYVYPKPWGRATKSNPIEDYEIPRDGGWLELACVMREVRLAHSRAEVTP